MKNIQFKSITALVLLCGLLFTSCGDSSSPKKGNKVTGAEESLTPTYDIAILNSEFATYNQDIRIGFTTALDDMIGRKNYTIHEYNAHSIDDIRYNAKSIVTDESTQLIFANGENAIKAMSQATHEIPVVAAGVYDIQETLGTGEAWSTPTGTNVTGVAGRSSMTDTLSLLIETINPIKQVAILISPEDTDSISQCRQLERYMDQAGIKWKEYSLLASDAYKTATTSLDGVTPPAMTEDQAESLIGDANNAVMQLAITECNCIFIPMGSKLTDQWPLIAGTANISGVPIVTGDVNFGRHALTCLYLDSFAIGYEAGTMAYQILVKGSKPDEMDISAAPASSLVKLYQNSIADAYGCKFPKTFHEIDSYLNHELPGASTERVKISDNEEE